MATTATFDMSSERSVAKVTAVLDDLHDVTWKADTAHSTDTSIDVFYDETPLWAYPVAALVAVAPWLIAAFTPLVDVSISAEDGIDLSTGTEAGASSLLLAIGSAVAIASLALGFYFATRFKRPVHQATITVTPEDGSAEATELSMTGSAERYIHLALRRVFEQFDREELAKRADPEGNFSIRDFLEIGPRPDQP